MIRRGVAIALAAALIAATAKAQPVSRILGVVVDEKGKPIEGADVNVEALYGYAAGTFAGQRRFSAKTDAKGKWNVLGLKSGVWIFEAMAPGYLPEVVGLPIRLLTTVSSRESGEALNWTLVLKPEPMPSGAHGEALSAALDAARAGKKEEAKAAFLRVPATAGPVYLAAAARIAVVAREFEIAHTLYANALQEDPSAYRTALGLATGFLVKRDFDSASRAFDAARARTHDKDEVRFITIALTDLSTIKVR
ncbi:MAG TPA: carboxypeptidase-like regulatory domain-containing protein [Vicinamibacterales bacterium]|nr:carboxypeptidase-like regulatory domain-containing protein [Vicinamibacterales bacterium]